MNSKLRLVGYAVLLVLFHALFSVIGSFGIGMLVFLADGIPGELKVALIALVSLMFAAVLVLLAVKRSDIITTVYLVLLALSAFFYLLWNIDVGYFAIAPLPIVLVVGLAPTRVILLVFYAALAGISVFRLATARKRTDAAFKN